MAVKFDGVQAVARHLWEVMYMDESIFSAPTEFYSAMNGRNLIDI